MYSTLIATEALKNLIERDAVCVIDCRFDLNDASLGQAAHEVAHIPGAAYAHLDVDLSGPPHTDNGRHPLPPPQQLINTFSRLGVSNDEQVVVYDDLGGMIAARAWWMLRYLGHQAVAVLDGGWQAWCANDLPVESQALDAARGVFRGRPNRTRLVVLQDIENARDLVDSRESQRFRGVVEPLDPRAGHIPGARNRPFKENLDASGYFLSPDELRQAIAATLGKLPDSDTVYYCGSGVSACHNILAQVHAGCDEPKLYCGSWSEWCADPDRPIAVGDGTPDD